MGAVPGHQRELLVGRGNHLRPTSSWGPQGVALALVCRAEQSGGCGRGTTWSDLAAGLRGDQVVLPHRSEFCWGAFATVQKIIGMILAQGQKPIIEGGQPTLGVCAPP